MISDLNTFLNKAVPDTRLTIKKYLDAKFEYLVNFNQSPILLQKKNVMFWTKNLQFFIQLLLCLHHSIILWPICNVKELYFFTTVNLC